MPGDTNSNENTNLSGNFFDHDLVAPREYQSKYKHLFLLIDIVGPKALKYLGFNIGKEVLDLSISCILETSTLNAALNKYNQDANRQYFKEHDVSILIDNLEERLKNKGLSKEKFQEIWKKYVSQTWGRWAGNWFFYTSGKTTLNLRDNIIEAASNAERMRLLLDFMRDKANQEIGSGFFKFLWENKDNRRFFPLETFAAPAEGAIPAAPNAPANVA